MGSILHNHADIDLPPSPPDLGVLFLDESSIILSPSIFVITKGTKFVIFRGQNTPQWSEDFVSAKTASWLSQITERAKQFQYQVNSKEENISLHRRVYSALLSQIAAKYDLKVFTCPTKQNTVNR
ncbi:MAG: hypothetical protein A2857_01890 [Candidatus Levybacteria bacterium RIFCSPHIGHO2_01_FULL_36_15]|nr:MAG: hypothetical protein A2857_01890 [Candidatus Levybacteria bacterium RIFCSPHIGHO2_01_FULL_36_15]